MYLFILPGFLFFVVFRYLPLAGNIVAFENYSPYLGIIQSEWVGLQNFVDLLSDPRVGQALVNTLIINGLQLVFFFPAPIALALLLNSILSPTVKRVIQTVVYLPYFIGWVVLVSVWQSVLGGDGLLNQVLADHGVGAINLMTNPDLFKPLMVLQYMWKYVGWGTIIFLAALTKIDPALYESAVVDGARPIRRMWHVTLPGIRGIAILLLILNLGNILTTGFEQILLQEPAVGAEAGQVLDTFVYLEGVVGGNWGLATAVGLFKGVVGTILILIANKVAHMLGEDGVF
ncbi:ABC transporter permease [Actinopolymorpha pittospori]|uniref:Aldouronate transport system permease protein n=1 Tax=Actinopolymorpha pittospori TaxID=648752 RepID=A0A927MXC8_9ACTN|nr:ABC transporter permease subunit [Actinopolymorpha pittospori]MBE1608334.1 putative aldouronate transport system permease protein [Actinopolymorpha pittospori]